MPEQLMTLDAVADYLAVTRRWVYDAITRHELPHVRVGRFIRVRPSDLEQWLAAGDRASREALRERGGAAARAGTLECASTS